MSKLAASVGVIRTPKHIRSMRSVQVSTGPGRKQYWPRLRETEALALINGKWMAERQVRRHNR